MAVDRRSGSAPWQRRVPSMVWVARLPLHSGRAPTLPVPRAQPLLGGPLPPTDFSPLVLTGLGCEARPSRA